MATNRPTHTPGPWDSDGISHNVWKGGVLIAISEPRPMGKEQEGAGNARLIAAAPELLAALKFQASWTMRDGTPCSCPIGRDEDEPRGKMPTEHATSCVYLRAAIAKAGQGGR